MPTYCTDAYLTEQLPTTLPASIDTAGERATYIARGSGRAEAAVGPEFAVGTFTAGTQKFPDVTGDTATTPEVIQEIAATFGVMLMLRKAYADGAISAALWREWEDRANELAASIRDGEVDVLDSDGTVYGSRARLFTNTTSGTRPTFTRGEYDADGSRISDYAGSLDDL